MNVRAEFLVEPFTEGAPGPHVIAAVETLERAGFGVEVGPFGSWTAGAADALLGSLAEAVTTAIAAGAHRVTLTIEAT